MDGWVDGWMGADRYMWVKCLRCELSAVVLVCLALSCEYTGRKLFSVGVAVCVDEMRGSKLSGLVR